MARQQAGGLAGIFPSRDEFASLAQANTIVPVAVELVADTVTPVAAFVALTGGGAGFLLESAEGDERWGRYSFVGARPLGTYTRDADGTTRVTGMLPAPDAADGALSYLERFLAENDAPEIDGMPPLHGGLVGMLAYDVVREVERIDVPALDDRHQPDAALHLIGELLAFDHWRQRVTAIVNVHVDGLDSSGAERAYEAACGRLQEIVVALADAPSLTPFEVPPRAAITPPASTSPLTSAEYQAAVAAAKERIVAGDIFQVVLSQRSDVELHASALNVYRALRVLNPSPYLYYLAYEECTVIGSSPEALVRLRDGTVTVRPIAGSRPRGETPEEDAAHEAALIADPKERAEHVMLVDLGRNDLGKVSTYGSVVVDEYMTVERFSHVMHLTSQVSGQLADGVSQIDVLRATLPAGTLSGAPKVRAMQIINELEPTRRGVYGGVVGYLDLRGNVDTAIAIRTLVIGADGHASVQAGAGIVADSDPRTEDLECHAKAAAVLAAVEVARHIDGEPPWQ